MFEELDKNRNEFKNLIFNIVLEKLQKSDLYFNNFQKFLSKNGMNLNLTKSKDLIKNNLNAEFARQLFNEDKFYEIILKNDVMIKKIIE